MTADRRILFFGDSFVTGVGDPEALGWVGRVVAAAYAHGRPLTAYNLGVRRDTSTDVAARWCAEARARTGAADASYGVVFSFGVNDASEEDGRPRVEPARTTENLVHMIAGARSLGLDVFVVGPPPAAERAHCERVRAMSIAFASVAHRRGLPYVDVLIGLKGCPAWAEEAARGDGAHPGAAGYAALAEIVLRGGFLEWLG